MSNLKLSIDIEETLVNNSHADVYVNGEYLISLDSDNRYIEKNIQFDSQPNRIKLIWKHDYNTLDKIKNIFHCFGQLIRSIFAPSVQVLNCPYEYEDEFEVFVQEDSATFEIDYLQIKAVQHPGFRMSHEHCDIKCQKNISILKKQLEKNYQHKNIILSVILALFTFVEFAVVFIIMLHNRDNLFPIISTVIWGMLVIRIIKVYMSLKTRYNSIKEKHRSIII